MNASRDYRNYLPPAEPGPDVLGAIGRGFVEFGRDVRAVLGLDPPPGETREREPFFPAAIRPNLSKDPDDYRWGRNEG